jgi:hypothetical protein
MIYEMTFSSTSFFSCFDLEANRSTLTTVLGVIGGFLSLMIGGTILLLVGASSPVRLWFRPSLPGNRLLDPKQILLQDQNQNLISGAANDPDF